MSRSSQRKIAYAALVAYTSVVCAFSFVFPGASYECLGLLKAPF